MRWEYPSISVYRPIGTRMYNYWQKESGNVECNHIGVNIGALTHARIHTHTHTQTHTHTHTQKKEVTRTIVWTVHLYDRNKSVFKLSMKVGFFHIGSHKGWVLLCPPINSYSWQRVCVGSRSGHTIHRGWFHQSYKSLCPINIRSMLTSSLRLDFSQSSLAYYYHIDKKIIYDIYTFVLKKGSPT